MLKALATDAFFIAAVFFETFAALSIAESTNLVVLREEFEPILAFYRGHVAPILAAGTHLVYAHPPQWYVDASVLSVFLFFLFFLSQTRSAMAPYEDPSVPGLSVSAPRAHEALIDWLLPPIVCAIGALILAPTLLPFLTLPAALVLASGRFEAKICWFHFPRGYFPNFIMTVAAFAAILISQR